MLILSGTLDSLTPRLHGATLVARQMGRSARLVTLANLTHVTLQDGNDACAASIYQRFVLRPGGLRTENTSCAARVAPVHAVGPTRLLAGAVPARPAANRRAGGPAGGLGRRGRVADEISRFPLLSGDPISACSAAGHFTPGATLGIRLHGVRWVSDAAIDGTARWKQAGRVTARLRSAWHTAPWSA